MSLVVTSSQRQAKHFSLRPRSVAGGGRRRPRWTGSAPSAEGLAARLEPRPVGRLAELERERRLRSRDRAGELRLAAATRGRRRRRRRRSRPAWLVRDVGAARPRPSAPWRRPGAAARSPGRVPPETATRSQSMPRSVSASARPSPVELGDHRSLHPPAPEGADHGAAPQERDAVPPRAAPSSSSSAPRRGGRRRRPTISTPASCRASADSSPRSAVVATTRCAARPDPVERRRVAAAPEQSITPGQVVALEHQRLLDRAGGGDVALGSDLVQRALRTRRARCRRRSRARRPAPAPRPRRREPARASSLEPRRRHRRAARCRRARGRRRRGPRRRPARRRAARRPCRRRRRRSRARRRGGGGTRCATRGLPGGGRSLPRPAAWRSTFS